MNLRFKGAKCLSDFTLSAWARVEGYSFGEDRHPRLCVGRLSTSAPRYAEATRRRAVWPCILAERCRIH